MTMPVLFVDLIGVVAVSTFALLFYYTLANTAALKIKNHKRRYPKAISAIGAATCLTFLTVTLPIKPEAWTTGIITLAIGTLYYWIKMKFLKKEPISKL